MKAIFKSIPDHWDVVPLSSVVFFQEGPGVRKHQYRDVGVKLLNGGNINDGVLNLSSTDKYISHEEANGKYTHFLVEEGDLLIACSGVVVEKFDGKIAYARKEHLPLCMNTSTMRFKSLDKNKLYLDYFRRFLSTYLFKGQLQKLITGSAQLNFGPSHIKQMFIPLPPLAEQKRIAVILDKADQLRQKRQQAIALADEFLRSVFLDMFGDPVTNTKRWEVKELSSFCSKVVDCPHSTPEYATGVTDYPCIRSSDLQNGKLDFSSTKYVEKDVYEDRVLRLTPRQGDLIFCREGARLGNLALVPEHRTPCLGQRTMLLRLNTEVATPEFMLHLLKSQVIQKEIWRGVLGGCPRIA